ncbi:MAG: diaminopimelate decarboxylase, partial [Deltaproteobacteria bacterium]|nr:diaminopimelate decarboxylase [Deltaproteobacteria bacterium]
YSVKANGSLAVLRVLAGLGGGADIVSGGELYRTSLAGIPPERVVYSGVGKTATELEAAISAGVLSINIENLQELEVISGIAEGLGRVQGCALRVNPDVDPHTHEYLTTGRQENKFGLPLDQVTDAAGLAADLPGIELTGLDFHIGSQILTSGPYEAALDQVKEIIADLRSRGMELKHLDIGGGLAARYGHERALTPDEFHDGIIHLVRDLDLILIMEPGRFIMANAGVLLATVQFVKETPERSFVIVDAGMNDLIRPALYGAEHRVEPVLDRPGDPRRVDVVGPICESGDFLAKDRDLPPMERDDLVCVFSAGAYGMTMSSNYNQRPRAAEVLVDGDRHELIRRRETYEDLVRQEV